MTGLPTTVTVQGGAPQSGIVNLRFEDCQFHSSSVIKLKDFLSKKGLIETLGIVNCTFQDSVTDFKRTIEGVQFSSKMRKLTLANIVFDEEAHGKSLGRMLSDSKTMRELDISSCEFQHPKSFFDCC